MSIERFGFVAKNFQSGQQVHFLIINESNNIVFDDYGTEWGNYGVYYITYNFNSNKNYLIIAEESEGRWKAAYMRSSIKNIFSWFTEIFNFFDTMF
jgi:hypothetical protein